MEGQEATDSSRHLERVLIGSLGFSPPVRRWRPGKSMTVSSKAPESGAGPRELLVSELYRSIQGESSYAGLPCAFVRLTGCPLRCVWCDSEFAFYGGKRMSIEEIVSEIAWMDVRLVEVTGGEPLAQPGCTALLQALCDGGYEVLLETSGVLDVSGVDPRVVKVIDVKCPGSGEEPSNRWENLEHLGPRDEIKFVLADRADYEYAREVIRTRGLERRGGLLLSAVQGRLDPAQIAAWMLEDGLHARLQSCTRFSGRGGSAASDAARPGQIPEFHRTPADGAASHASRLRRDSSCPGSASHGLVPFR